MGFVPLQNGFSCISSKCPFDIKADGISSATLFSFLFSLCWVVLHSLLRKGCFLSSPLFKRVYEV